MGIRGVLTLVLAVSVVVPACSSSDGGATSSGTDSSSTVASNPARCAWKTRADKQTANIAYPDTSATYWGLSYQLAKGETLELSGKYPDARYFSFTSYGLQGGAIDVLTDRDINPDRGKNPFRPGNGRPSTTAGSYTAVIRPDLGQTDEANVVGAKADATSGTGSEPPVTTPAEDDRVFLGNGGSTGVGGTVLYRVYTPTDAGDPTGGVGLPSVHLVEADGTRTEIPTCPKPGASKAGLAVVNNINRVFEAPPPTPIFIRPKASQSNIFPNPDNIYVATTVKHQPGQIVVLRGKAPTFPDTRAGDPITGDEQVRFWSLCTNEARKPYPVTDCKADSQVALDDQGWYTFVISTPQDRPKDTPATAGSTWLDWGATDVSNLLLFRNMLPNPTFPEAANNVEPGALAAPAMGDYAPTGAYCDVATFERGGASACGL
jgi:hypothetical protein